MNKFKAVIFDCDGVLMDSESLACDVSAKALTENDYPITTDEYIDRFMGNGFKEVMKIISKETGEDFEKKITASDKNAIRKKIFEDKLEATKDMHEVLEKLDVPFCIASGSAMERLDHSLKVVDLYKYFEGRVFSSELVENGKPAPDVFLYAADKINVKPEDCLVIEDGYHGTHGAIAAGMTVYGFTGASHMNDERIKMLKDAGAEKLFDDMRELNKFLA